MSIKNQIESLSSPKKLLLIIATIIFMSLLTDLMLTALPKSDYHKHVEAFYKTPLHGTISHSSINGNFTYFKVREKDFVRTFEIIARPKSNLGTNHLGAYLTKNDFIRKEGNDSTFRIYKGNKLTDWMIVGLE